MSEIKPVQLNKTPWEPLSLPEKSAYIEFPLAFTGKAKNGSTSVFAGLNLSCQFILAIIHTFNKIYKEPAKLTYEFFVQNFGMSKETVSGAIKTLFERGILEKVKLSRYRIVVKYRKNDYVEIDNFWFKHAWNVQGKNKRLTYSRLLSLGLLKRSCSNPKTDGVFVSSQARIGKALNLPRTTAGDSIRELIAANLTRYNKAEGNDARKRGCSLYEINPALFTVKHPNLNLSAIKELFKKPDVSPEQLHAKLMGDNVYKRIIDDIEFNNVQFISKVRKSCGEDTPALQELEAEKERLRQELEEYLKRKRIQRSVFPPGFFRTDITNNDTF